MKLQDPDLARRFHRRGP